MNPVRAGLWCLLALAACGHGAQPAQRNEAKPMNQPALAVLDQVDPFWHETFEPMFSEPQMKAIAELPDPAQALRAVIVDDRAPLGRRYAAVEAAAQGGWTAWMQAEADARVVASVLAQGLAQDRLHNRWGLPGSFVGATGRILVGLRAGVREALAPLLSDCRLLEIIGSQEATLQRAHGYRICDLAGYLLAQHEHVPWEDAPDPAARDRNLERLRKP